MISVVMKIGSGKKAMSGGLLDGKYEFAHFHYHWGAKGSGSEDKIGGRSFALELHIEFLKNQYLDSGKLH